MFTAICIIGSVLLFILSVVNIFYFSRYSTSFSYSLFILNFFGAFASFLGILYFAFRIAFIEAQFHKLDSWVELCGTDSRCVDKVLAVQLSTTK